MSMGNTTKQLAMSTGKTNDDKTWESNMSCTVITVGSWFVSTLIDSIQHGNNPRVGHFILPALWAALGVENWYNGIF